MRLLLFLFAAILTAGADMHLYPKRTCGLYNNLKHTQDSGNLRLDMHHTYEMLRHHKGQYLVKVPDATPSQRWVDDDCLTLRPLRGTPLYEEIQASRKSTRTTVASKESSVTPVATPSDSTTDNRAVSRDNLLALSWHNAFCETHRYKKECKRTLLQLLKAAPGDDRFVLHGLWPQPRHKVYCGVPRQQIRLDKQKRWQQLPPLDLSEETRERLQRLMPGYSGYLHRHEWIKHGTCYGTDAEHYFATAAALTEAVNRSEIGAFFHQNRGKRVDLKRIRMLFDKTFGRGTGYKVSMQCKQGMITELWLHIGGSGEDLAALLKQGKAARSRCRSGRIDKAGFGR